MDLVRAKDYLLRTHLAALDREGNALRLATALELLLTFAAVLLGETPHRSPSYPR